MNKHEPKLYDLVNTQNPNAMYKEIRDVLKFFARKRLTEDFDNPAANMRCHFKEKWGIDRDLYHSIIKFLISSRA